MPTGPGPIIEPHRRTIHALSSQAGTTSTEPYQPNATGIPLLNQARRWTIELEDAVLRGTEFNVDPNDVIAAADWLYWVLQPQSLHRRPRNQQARHRHRHEHKILTETRFQIAWILAEIATRGCWSTALEDTRLLNASAGFLANMLEDTRAALLGDAADAAVLLTCHTSSGLDAEQASVNTHLDRLGLDVHNAGWEVVVAEQLAGYDSRSLARAASEVDKDRVDALLAPFRAAVADGRCEEPIVGAQLVRHHIATCEAHADQTANPLELDAVITGALEAFTTI